MLIVNAADADGAADAAVCADWQTRQNARVVLKNGGFSSKNFSHRSRTKVSKPKRDVSTASCNISDISKSKTRAFEVLVVVLNGQFWPVCCIILFIRIGQYGT